LTVGLDGDVYIADQCNYEVEKVTSSGTLSIIAGTGTDGKPAAGPATSSDLTDPVGVAVDSAGNVYIADANSAEVLKVTPSGTSSEHLRRHGNPRQPRTRPSDQLHAQDA
jgi:DNA-binding beta-propeller fold protein YncE